MCLPFAERTKKQGYISLNDVTHVVPCPATPGPMTKTL